jgi:hypothetical protein
MMQVLDNRRLTRLFLDRLTRLVSQEEQAQTPAGQAMVSRAILSTYRDCRDLGITAEAERILSARRPRLYTDV